MSFSVRIVTFNCGIASFSVQLELCHLVFGSNCFIYCSARIVSFSVRFELCHLLFGSNCVI